MRIALGSDHAGFPFKERVKAFLPTLGHEVVDFGTFSDVSCDYPDFVVPAAQAVGRGDCPRAIVFGGSGNGEAIAANKIRGIRCGLCWTVEAARLNRAHNDGNVLSLGARLVPADQLLEIVRVWLATPFEGGRHVARLNKLAALGSPAGPAGPGSGRAATDGPATDPTRLFELLRGNFSTELLIAAVAHFDVFARLAAAPLDLAGLGTALGLGGRATQVLVTALRAMGTLADDGAGRLGLTPLAREHLVPGGEFYMGDYCGLAAQSPGVLGLVERLRTNRPAGAAEPGRGAAFIFRAGIESAMEQEASARSLTLALAGRARNVAPVLAERLPLAGVRRLIDVGGGTGIYSLALLRRNPELRVVLWDRPEVLKVAAEFAAASGVGDRLELVPGDMFTDPFPEGAEVVLLSNILHDWDVPEVRRIVARCAAGLAPGGRLVVHDVFLDDDLAGPLAAALYSANLFVVTEGRLYSAAELSGWLAEAGIAGAERIPTLIHCEALIGVRR